MKFSSPQKRVDATTTLRELTGVLNEIRAEIAQDCDSPVTLDQLVDIGNLPTFGGEDPANTSEVWSWDETHVLLTDGEWCIGDRCECGEASFHCTCM